MKSKFKLFCLSLLLVNLLLCNSVAYAQQTSGGQVSASDDYRGKGAQSDIERFLCAPSEPPANQTSGMQMSGGTQHTTEQVAATNTGSRDLYNCINKLYKFAIALASAVGVLMIVIAGYLYMSAEGNKEAVDKAKGIIVSTVTALVLLFSGFVLLKALNPDLVEFQNVQPPSVNLPPARLPELKDPFTGATLSGATTPAQTQAAFQSAGIDVKLDANTNGLQSGIIQEITKLKQVCGANCPITVTSGTDGNHASGACSHANGYKVDLRLNDTLTNYIKSNFRPNGKRSDDNAPLYVSPSNGVYALESNHWDVAQCSNQISN